MKLAHSLPILMTAVFALLVSCADGATAPALPENNSASQFQNQNPQNSNPFANNNCPPTSDSSSLGDDLLSGGDSGNDQSSSDATSGGSGGFDDPNRFTLTDDGSQSGGQGSDMGDLLDDSSQSNNSNDSSNIGSPSSNCPPSSGLGVGTGEQTADNKQINEFFTPQAMKDCNARGKVYHRKTSTCLESYTLEKTWCNRSSIPNEFGGQKAEMEAKLVKYVDSIPDDKWKDKGKTYSIDQCGSSASGSYVGLVRLLPRDDGADLNTRAICTDSSLCGGGSE